MLQYEFINILYKISTILFTFIAGVNGLLLPTLSAMEMRLIIWNGIDWPVWDCKTMI